MSDYVRSLDDYFDEKYEDYSEKDDDQGPEADNFVEPPSDEERQQIALNSENGEWMHPGWGRQYAIYKRLYNFVPVIYVPSLGDPQDATPDWASYPGDIEALRGKIPDEVIDKILGKNSSVGSKTNKNNRKFKDSQDESPEEIRRRIAWRFGDEETGMIILSEGSGGGFHTLPDVFDDYQNIMGLTIPEVWWIKLMWRYASGNGLAYPSQNRIAERTGVHRREIFGDRTRDKEGIIPSLIRKGMIRRVPSDEAHRSNTDTRVRYDLSNVWFALRLCIEADPNSNISFKDHASHEFEVVKEIAEVQGIELNWEALQELTNSSVPQ
jgi:hypothetical protein